MTKDVHCLSFFFFLFPTSLGSMCLWPANSQHFPPWVGVSAPAEQLKDIHQIVVYIPSEGTRNM